MSSITAEDIDDFLDALSRKPCRGPKSYGKRPEDIPTLSSSTVKKCFTILTSGFETAKKWHYISEIPKVTAPTEKTVKRRAWDSRHQRHRQRVRRERGQIAHGSFQLRPVVDAGAEHDLTVKAHVVVGKAAKVFHDAVGMDVVQHLFAQFAVGRLHRDIQRAGVALDHAIHFLRRQVGQRHKIARHQREPPIVVAHIEAGTHARRHLLDKAEHAVVRAGLRAAHQGGFERQPERLLDELVNVHRARLAVVILQQHFQRRTCGEILIIDQIEHRRSVDGNERFPFPDAAARGKRTGVNANNTLGHGNETPSFSK